MNVETFVFEVIDNGQLKIVIKWKLPVTYQIK